MKSSPKPPKYWIFLVWCWWSIQSPATAFQRLETTTCFTGLEVIERRALGVWSSQEGNDLLIDAIHQESPAPGGTNNRRSVLARVATSILASTSILCFPIDSSYNRCWAADAATGSPFMASQIQKAESTELGVGLLESRVTENVLSPPSYGMEAPDIFYPSWFKGTWQVSSKTIDIQAPCGIALFGGNVTYERARNEIETKLNYESRFLSDGAGHIIADREYNVQSIAKAAMGQYSVIDMPVATPNKLTCILVPKNSPNMLKVDLIALNRRQETISENRFDCSEVTREIVALVNSNNNPQTPSGSAPILKEVETTSLYTFNPATNEIQCQQRSATFLLPSQTSPIAFKMWEAARGRPVDARFYDVRYTKSS